MADRELTMEEEMMRDFYIKKASGYDVPKKSEITQQVKLSEAINTFISALKGDASVGSYYYGWQSNLAMAFYDTFRDVANQYDGEYTLPIDDLHMVCNDAAKAFLNQLIK